MRGPSGWSSEGMVPFWVAIWKTIDVSVVGVGCEEGL